MEGGEGGERRTVRYALGEAERRGGPSSVTDKLFGFPPPLPHSSWLTSASSRDMQSSGGQGGGEGNTMVKISQNVCTNKCNV